MFYLQGLSLALFARPISLWLYLQGISGFICKASLALSAKPISGSICKAYLRLYLQGLSSFICKAYLWCYLQGLSGFISKAYLPDWLFPARQHAESLKSGKRWQPEW